MRKHVLLKLSKQVLENLRLELSTPGEGKTGIHKDDVRNLDAIREALKKIKEDEQKAKDGRR